MDEVKNTNFSFKNKSYMDALLQKSTSQRTCYRKGNIKERDT